MFGLLFLILGHTTTSECPDSHTGAQECAAMLESLSDTCSVASFVLTSELLSSTDTGSGIEQTAGGEANAGGEAKAGGDGEEVENDCVITDEAQGDDRAAVIEAGGAGEDEGDNEDAENEASGKAGKAGVGGHPENEASGDASEAGEGGIQTTHDIHDAGSGDVTTTEQGDPENRDGASGDAGSGDVTTTKQDTQGDPENLDDDKSGLDRSLLSGNGAALIEEIPATVATLPIYVIPTTEEGKSHGMAFLCFLAY